MYDGKFFNKTVNGFSSGGYNIYFNILRSSDYGVPQMRERVFIFGSKLNNHFQFPNKSLKDIGRLKSYKNVGQAIQDLISQKNSLPNHLILNHSDKVISRYKLILEGGKLPPPEKLPKHIRRSNFDNWSFSLAKTCWSRASISCVMSSVVRQNRTFLPRAHAAIPNAMARCVLPVPGLPTSNMFSRWSIYVQRINSVTRDLLILVCALKSKLSSVFGDGNLAAFNRLTDALRSRSSSSNSVISSKNPK